MADLTDAGVARPVDALAERLNDPTVAASLVTLLDHAELLSTLVLGLGGFMERGDMIMDAVAEGVNDFKAGTADQTEGPLAELAQMRAVGRQLAELAPVIETVAHSKMVEPETLAFLSEASAAATEGVANARINDTELGGIRDLWKAVRDDDVQKGLGILIEISRSLGRRLG